MIPAKQEALESIPKLPDDADMEEINQGQITTSGELRREIEKR